MSATTTTLHDADLVELRAVATTSDGQQFEFAVLPDGTIQRWGNTADAIGTAVVVTERIREAMTA